MQEALIILGGLGLIIGIGLALASKIFYVYVDPQVLAVEGALPGANCGGCGLPGCSANAEAIVLGKSSPTSCVAAGSDVIQAIAEIMGVSVTAKEPEIARPGCTYGVPLADLKFTYDGVPDCRAAALLSGGMKVCTIGCLGLGTCARACPFGAIRMGSDGLPQVNAARCTGCGVCERICPKHIITLSSVTRRILKEYTIEECTTPCQRACPAGIDICAYIGAVAEGDYDRAVQVIKERNPFPAVIGRICPRPCEQECRRQMVDEPVAINALKRFAADYQAASGRMVLPFKAPESDRRVAVIGGGVEGLSTAFFLARLGHSATVFEATAHLGGLLRSAIARNRLPLSILDADIEGIRAMGVVLETGKPLGGALSATGLLAQGFQAVFLATGGWDSRLARGAVHTAERAIPGVELMIDLLAAGGKGSCQPAVVIAGGGGQALEAARRCRQQGARTVTILFREQAGAAAVCDEELAPLATDGISVLFERAIMRLQGVGERLQQVTVARLDGSERLELPADTLLLASGRLPEVVMVRAAEGGAEEGTDPATLLWEALPPYKAPAFVREKGLLAEGDVLSDYSGAIRAIGAGRRAAASLHQILYGLPLTLPETVLTPDKVIQNVSHLVPLKSSPRSLMPLNPQAWDGQEIEKGFDETMARREAGRCLKCGLICYRRLPVQQEAA